MSVGHGLDPVTIARLFTCGAEEVTVRVSSYGSGDRFGKTDDAERYQCVIRPYPSSLATGVGVARSPAEAARAAAEHFLGMHEPDDLRDLEDVL